MYIAVDALANVDDTKLSYLIFPFDEDLLEAIEENLREIRIDNEITRLADHVSLLQMHCKIINDISSLYNYLHKS